MSPDELRDYAATLILDHARNVEYLTIFEMAEDELGGELSEEDGRKVSDLINEATVVVSFPGTGVEYSSRDENEESDDD